jgi:hypothetical protein
MEFVPTGVELAEYKFATIIGLVKELVDAGIHVTLMKEEDEYKVFFENGFYKSGSTHITCECNVLVMCSRYDRTVVISNLEDIVTESYYWYEFSKDRFEGWKTPVETWSKLYEKFNLGS